MGDINRAINKGKIGRNVDFVLKQKNPFHVIKHKIRNKLNEHGKEVKVAEWLKYQLYADFEHGNECPNDPLTRALRFNVSKYVEGIRQEDYYFKLPNCEELIQLIDWLTQIKENWLEYLNNLSASNKNPTKRELALVKAMKLLDEYTGENKKNE